MTDPEIKPRIGDGGGWCDEGCPQATEVIQYVDESTELICAINQRALFVDELCPHHTARMAALLRKGIMLLTTEQEIEWIKTEQEIEWIKKIVALLGEEVE